MGLETASQKKILIRSYLCITNTHPKQKLTFNDVVFVGMGDGLFDGEAVNITNCDGLYDGKSVKLSGRDCSSDWSLGEAVALSHEGARHASLALHIYCKLSSTYTQSHAKELCVSPQQLLVDPSVQRVPSSEHVAPS